MSADITIRADGTAEMAYAGKTPWHGLGTAVDHPMTAAEAIELAGLDWEVESQSVFILPGDGKGNPVLVPGKQALVRSDNEEVLQIFSDTYVPVQNKEAFTFFDGVVGSGEAIYETAGSLKGGRRIWILAKLPGDLDIGDGDLLEKYILLANSHDGTMRVTMKITPIRVVCKNTLEVALGGDALKFRHTSNILNKMNDTREFLGLAEAHFELFMRNAERLAAKAFTEGNVRDIAAKVFDFEVPHGVVRDSADLPKQAPRKIAAANRVVELWSGEGRGAAMSTAHGTAWGAFNAFTEYFDHELGVAEAKAEFPDSVKMAGQRMNISWFGVGQKMRQTAWDMALATT